MRLRHYLPVPVILLHCLVLATAAASLTPHDVARLRMVTSASISPDGSRAAFTLSVPRVPGTDEDGRAWTELHVVDLKSGSQIPFITGKVNIGGVAWTPDSRTIVFLDKRTGDEYRSLYGIDVAGGEARRLLALTSDIDSYSVGTAADGSARVALLAEEPPSKELREQRKQGFAQRIYEEDWVPKRLWIADLAGGEPVRREIPGSGVLVAWSPVPGSDTLAVSVVPKALVDDTYVRQRVWILSGTKQVEVPNEGKLEQMAWSPDGGKLALLTGRDINDPHAGRVAVADPGTGALTWPEPEDSTSVSGFAWLGEDELVLLEGTGVWTDLRILSPSRRSLRSLLPAEGPILSSISLSRQAKVAVGVVNTPAHPPELYLIADGLTRLRRLTDSNPWLKEVTLAPQRVVRYRARDGMELEGMLIPPLGSRPGQPYPLIVSVHGGPEAHHSQGWLTSYSLPGQVAAARGMGVFYPNYRGSTGRGVAFAKLGQNDAAGKEFDDLVDGVDHLVREGLVDARKVGVTGGSYGGYATAWCSTYYSERFAAGVMFVGISNKISKFGTTDIPDEEYYVHALKRPWEAWEFMMERSPIYHADRHRTPLLILHGADDPRVNVGQSRELYRHLKVRDQAPVRLVLYPGEQHGNAKAGARLDYHLRMLRWMEHYLVGPGGAPPAYPVDYELGKFATEPAKEGGK